jgi:NTE family protein
VTATNVRTGRGRVFRNNELTPDVLLVRLPADAVSGHRDRRRCLLGLRPFGQSDHHPIGARVRITRYTVRRGQSCRTPRHAAFGARDPRSLNEVSFNATLLKELRMIALLRQVADAGTGEGAYGQACAFI